MLKGISATTTLLAACAALSVPLLAASDAAVEEVRARYAECQAIRTASATAKSNAAAVYTDGDYSKDPRWVKAAPSGAEVMSELTAFKSDGKIRSATLFQTSPSGDWAQTFDYCYRPDGTLAFILAELRTFRGNVRVVDRLYYSSTGVQIRKIRKHFNLDTNKPISGTPPPFQDLEVRVLATTGELVAHARPALD